MTAKTKGGSLLYDNSKNYLLAFTVSTVFGNKERMLFVRHAQMCDKSGPSDRASEISSVICEPCLLHAGSVR